MLTYARLQGLESLIDHFQNSKVLNQKDKKYPILICFDAQGRGVEPVTKYAALGDEFELILVAKELWMDRIMAFLPYNQSITCIRRIRC